jgi:hypothetical protein
MIDVDVAHLGTPQPERIENPKQGHVTLACQSPGTHGGLEHRSNGG